ncbi:YibE/F family protein [uncultured Limosilactobacillus sp.]|uniref:YibE/F family protein n=1 Tax=uncultured Limosilactobacillus sp. TaxID=2837629 RepID=UPI00265FB3C6|nr:YibE/F family protein [uncultured Limosilactobacillus sp.]
MVKQYWTRRRIWLLISLVILGLAAVLFTSHNERFYRQPIAKVMSEQTVGKRRVKDQFDNVDHQYSQRLRVKLMNGKYRNQELTVQNTYSDSQPMDQHYRVGNEIFLTQVHKQNGKLTANVDGYKRDTVIVFLLWLVILMLLLLMGRPGLFALLSVVINAILFLIAIEIDLRQNGQHIMILFSILAVIFTFISLLLVLGFSKRMLATFAATVMGTFIALGVSMLVFAWTHERGVYYESMEYVTQVPRPLFLAETLLGSLGAVMDESSDIIATLFELKQLNPQVTRRQLFISGRNVGKSIMGPLINVLFLIFMVETFTGSLLYIKNGNSWGYTYAMNMSLGTIQSLISGIGIVLSVPLVSLFGALLLGKKVPK